MKRPKLNVKLLRQVKAAILKHPRQFNIGQWFSSVDSQGDEAGGCGTAACIAGWACHIGGNNKTLEDTENNQMFACVQRTAIRLLGLTPQQGGRLFYRYDWPAKYRRIEIKNAKEAAQVAAKRIDHFLKTGK